MKIPAILVTSLLVWGLASGRVIESSAAASAQASASAGVSHIGVLHGKPNHHHHHYLVKDDKKGPELDESSLNMPALKLGIKNGGLDVAKGAGELLSALSDESTYTDQRSLLDLGLGVVANGAEILAESQAIESSNAGANANQKIAQAMVKMEEVDKDEYVAAIIMTKAAKAAEATMASIARAAAAAEASKLSSEELLASAGNAAEAEARANAASIIANKMNAVMAEAAAELAATAAEAEKSAIELLKIAEETAKIEAEITKDAGYALVALSKAKAAIARAAAEQAVCTSQAQAASQIQSRASASESAASAQSETNTATAENVAAADAEAASQSEMWVQSLKHDQWLQMNMKGEAKSKASAVTIGKHGGKRVGGFSEASAEASSNVFMGGRHGRKDSVSEALAGASAGSSDL